MMLRTLCVPRHSFGFVLCGFLLSACSGESMRTNIEETDFCERVQASLTSALPETGAPGALLLVRSPDEPDCAVAAGISDTSEGTPASPDQLYHIGSSTKTFIGASMLLLFEDGAFDTEEKEYVEYWLPGVVRDGASIHINHLLTHTSGLYNYTTDLDLNPTAFAYDEPTTSENLVAIAERHDHEFAPGARFAYSNTGYILLGMIIERASGMTWGELVQERLLTPLNLEHTYIDRLQVPEGTPLLRSYGPVQGQDVDATELVHPSWFEAAGSMVSSLEDMARWNEALYGGELFQGEVLDALLTPAVTVSAEAHVGYSVGTILKDTEFGAWAGHGGTVSGSLSYMGGLYERGMYVEAVVNHHNGNRFAAADAGWKVLLGEPLGAISPTFVPK